MSTIDKILDRSGDPELAHQQFEELRRYFNKIPSKLEPLLYLFGNSRPLIHYLLRNPKEVSGILRPASVRKLRTSFSRWQGDLPTALKILRGYRQRELIRISVRELAGIVPFETIGREISALADGLIEMSVRIAQKLVQKERAAGPSPFAVIGLGKLGAEDLNFSSDVDLLYLRNGEPPELFSRLGESVTRLLQEKTEDGFAFRVDLGLRPDGKAGELVPLLEATLDYYHSKAAPWEHAALTRARFVAGEKRLGRAFEQVVDLLIYHRYRDATVVEDLKQIKKKIKEQLVTKGFNVKLSDGGIREIEFFIQAFQLLYGGGHTPLRARHPLPLLTAIQSLGIVPTADLTGLREAYLFLRRIENHLQRLDDRQVHQIPEEAAERLALARRMGFASTGEFEAILKRHTDHVRHVFADLLPQGTA